MIVKGKRDITRAALIHETAEKTGYSKRYVRYVLESQRENETVTAVYMTLLEGHNTLLQAVNELVPFIHTPNCKTPTNEATHE